MDTSKLKKFAQAARQELLEQVGSKLAFVLKPESPSRREYPTVVNELEKAMSAHGKAALIDQVAYTWFNRFCALRFMDVNGYNRVGVVSPSEGQVQPEILAEAKSGVIDEDQINSATVEKIRGLLNGSIPSPDAQSEAYRLLIVGSCNSLYDRMPYLFERIADFTELLMPDDLLSDNSILTKMREVMTPESCTDVEVIGWLYQFYISEKKDEVFAGLKKNQKITAENIPAATQLFTPHWIVRYLVENSLGRIWMLNRPNSKLTEQMEYYIAPEEPEKDFLKVSSPEEIKIADPAAGSGHMLTYAFDLLYAIYEEEGYDPNDIPGLILSSNLYGIEIDERAGALASFALEMKAAAKLGRRRFFRMDTKPNVCVLEDVTFTDSEMDDVMSIVGKDLYSADLRETLTQFEQAKNFGSLIVPKLKDPAETLRLIETKDLAGDMWLAEVHERLVKVLRMAEYLSPKYHVVVANPPYLGGKGMNKTLTAFAKQKYKDSKSDLLTMFMERSLDLIHENGFYGMLNLPSWMYLSSFEKLRIKLLKNAYIFSLLHCGRGLFGPDFGTVAFCVEKTKHKFDKPGTFRRLFKKHVEVRTPEAIEKNFLENKHGSFIACSRDFGKIPGSPLAYSASKRIIDSFSNSNLGDISEIRGGMSTSNNERFLRRWYEVSREKIGNNLSRNDALISDFKWFPYNKGGEYRKWYGNHEYVVNWCNNGEEIKHAVVNNPRDPNTTHWSRRIFNTEYFFEPGITWGDINSGDFSARILPQGNISDSVGIGAYKFASEELKLTVLGLLNSSVFPIYASFICPTIHFNSGPMSILPLPGRTIDTKIYKSVDKLVSISKNDWDTNEISKDFSNNELVEFRKTHRLLEDAANNILNSRFDIVEEARLLEIEVNEHFISAYSLSDEANSEVDVSSINLFKNIRFGISKNANSSRLKINALEDISKNFISYSVGSLFGRYSIDSPGLIIASQGETLADYLARIPEPTFMPDDDNVIPMIDFEGDWFEDDISERFKQFLRVTFGDEHYAENLAFIEDALGKSIQKYFVKDFYADHVQRYKKRPIYWLFSSPKGTFNALIYMHRYTPSTASVVLNEYLREFRTKLEARRDSNEQISISASSSQKEKTSALKMIDKLNKAIEEVNDYERDVLYPLAGQNIAIDLDDGVKHNYPLFGTALKKITGLS
jgi:type II restriction/modification system DNA methylase subunit YeeA